MKTFKTLIILMFASTTICAQQNYFVYIQTDNKQPFYVKLNDKVMSSSASGYVVIPKLNNGTYNIGIGFPNNKWPQQNLPLIINKADAGYLLKNFGETGWGLYNLQSMEVTMNNAAGKSQPAPATASQDIFVTTLSGAANTDLTVNNTVPAPKPAVKEVPKKAEIIVAETTQKTEKNKISTPEIDIKKISSANDADGKSYTYIDNMQKGSDTIKIFIPISPKQEMAKQEIPKKEIAQPVAVNKPAIKKEDEEKATQKDSRFLDIDMRNPTPTKEETAVVTKEEKKSGKENKTRKDVNSVPVVSINSDCKNNADDDDFLKIRKKMANASTNEGMVTAATKFFKSTCFSVEQIKNLSQLFLNDEGKYKFFDAAYPHVNDTQNFTALESQLSDEYFISRFKAMLHR